MPTPEVVEDPDTGKPVAAYLHEATDVFQRPGAIWLTPDGGYPTDEGIAFETQFELTEEQARLAVLEGDWAVDNFGEILLNGLPAEGEGPLSLTGDDLGNWYNNHHFKITKGFGELAKVGLSTKMDTAYQQELESLPPKAA